MELYLLKKSESGWCNSSGRQFSKVIAVFNDKELAREAMEQHFKEDMETLGDFADTFASAIKNTSSNIVSWWDATIFSKENDWRSYNIEVMRLNGEKE